MAFSAAVFGVAAATAAGAILKFESENVLNDGPSALLNPNPNGAIPSIAQAIARQTCRRYADGVDGLDEGTAANLETVCRPYLDNIGYGAGATLKLPFRGGQCPVPYRLIVQTANPNTGEPTTPEPVEVAVRQGPIGYISLDAAPGGCVGGAFGEASFAFASPTNAFQPISIHGAGCVLFSQRLVTRVERVDGLPDDCGDPTPIFTEPVPPTEPGPDTERFNPGNDIDINIELTLRPDSLIEVNFGVGPIVVPIFGGGGGDGDGGDGGDGGGGGGGPSDGGAPGAAEPGPEIPGGNGGFGGDDAFGNPPTGKRWVGACIRIVSAPGVGRVAGSAPEDVYPRVVGNARLVYNAAGSRVVDTPVKVHSKGTCLWESVRGLNPVGVNVDLLPGFTYVYTPYAQDERN